MANASSTTPTPQTPQDAAQQLQSQFMPSPLLSNSPQQDPQAAQQALLASLKDLHTPPPIGSWPVAPGWWVLAGSGLVLLLGALFALYRRWRRTAYRRAGLRLLGRLQPQAMPAQRFARQLNEILKRAAIAAPCYQHSGIAAAHGTAWSQFLCASVGAYPHKESLCQQLITALYQRQATLDNQALLDFARYWMQHHQPLMSLSHAPTTGATP